MADAKEVEVEVQSIEEQQILLWRLEQFRGLGFEYEAAVALAEAPADIGQARRLIAAGCSVEVASRILL